MDVILIALIGLVGLIITGVVGPFVIAKQLNRQRAAEKAEEWKRADALTARAEASAEAIVAAQSAASRVTIGKLDTIHQLVNSSMTAQKEATIAALEQSLTLLHQATPVDHEAIVAIREKIVALSVEVAERKLQDLAARPGIRQTARDEAVLAKLPEEHGGDASTEPEPVVLAPGTPVVIQPGTPVVIEGTIGPGENDA